MEDINVEKMLQLNEEDAASVDSPVSTPDLKSGFNRPKDGSDSSSSSLSSDSDSESFNSSGNAYFSIPPVSTDLKALRFKLGEEEENGTRDDLLERVVKYEDELKVSKMNQRLLENEVACLKSELERSNAVAKLIAPLQVQLQLANSEIQAREEDLQSEKMQHVLALEEIAPLKAELDLERTRSSLLEESNACLVKDVLSRDQEIKALKLEMVNAVEKLSLEKLGIQGEMTVLLEKQGIWEEKQTQYEAEKREMLDEISRFKTEVTAKCKEVECLNKSFDELKLKHDMLVAEKDELIAKVNRFVADVNSRDDYIHQLEDCKQQLESENLELKSRSGNAEKQADEFKTNVAELEIEVSAVAEAKREAIRQLCFCLEHYRSGYEELRQSIIGHKRQVVVAS